MSSKGWRFENNNRLDLKADKTTYKPGDVAHVLVPSPYADATALVTIERGRVISRKVMQVGSSTVLDVPVEKSYYPNVYVAVVLVPRSGATSVKPSFKVGYAELRVQSDDGKLAVSVSADKQGYRPGDAAAFTVKTVDSGGKPVSAEVSLDIVDAALLALAQDNTQDIVNAFYGRRNLSVQVGGNMAVLLDRVNERKDFGGGGGEPDQAIRKVFPDTAYWNPTITTGADGTAQVKVTLPDNLTTWRAFAKGVTASTQVGAGTNDLVVTKDLIVRPVLPRFFMTGDKATIGGIVHNFTGKDADINVGLIMTGAIALGTPGGTAQTVHVASGSSAKIEWPIAVGEAQTVTVTMCRANRRRC